MALTPIASLPDPNNPGKCCNCAVQEVCDCPGVAGNLQCQSIAGTAVFCGYPEYVPSTPPLFYHTRTLTGSVSVTCGNSICSGPGPCTQTLSYSGSNTYNPLTCVLVQNAVHNSSGTCDPPIVNAQRSDIGCGDMFAAGVTWGCADVFVTTGHTFFGSQAGDCVPSGSGFTACVAPVYNFAGTLSDQDTIDQALFRELGPNPAYSTHGADCSGNTSFTTEWTSATFGFSKAQVRVQIPFSTAGHTYQCVITLVERATGSVAPYTPFGMITITVTSPPAGGNFFTPWTDIPLEAGIQIMAQSVVVTDVT